MKKINILFFVFSLIGFSVKMYSQNICTTIGNDSLALYNAGYIIGPQNLDCGQNIHTESKWINVTGTDTLYVNTFQHRFYDNSKIYDANNNLIWSWLGESTPAITWYLRHHTVFVGGNDSVRIEFYQGYPDPFCNGYLQVVGIYCAPINSTDICQSIGTDSLALYNAGYIIGPQNLDCGQNIHTESKWINVTGADSLFVNTFQHRLYDFSKIYDVNNNLIWSWLGENAPAITWYLRHHAVFVGGNDSVRIEFHQGYPDPFCNGYLQVVGMYCQPNSAGIQDDVFMNTFVISPNPTNGILNIHTIDDAKTSSYVLLDPLGKVLLKGNTNKELTTIDLSLLPKGIYFLMIDEKENYIFKVLKE